MKHYEVMLYSGSCPLVYTCGTIAEAYSCIVGLERQSPEIPIDLGILMECLVGLEHGDRRGIGIGRYRIDSVDWEVKSVKLEATGTLGFGEYNVIANGVDLLRVLAEHFDANGPKRGLVTGKISIEVTPLEMNCTVDGVKLTAPEATE